MIWKPLHARFQELETRMKFHEEMLLREATVTDQEDLTAHFESFQNHVQNMEALRQAGKLEEKLREAARASTL